MKTKTLCKTVVALLSMAFTMLCQAQHVIYEGDTAQSLNIAYEIGRNNNVVGEVRNTSAKVVDVTVEFKGYAADGHVIQGNPLTTIRYLSPGESARFQCAGFFEHVNKLALVRVKTSP